MSELIVRTVPDAEMILKLRTDFIREMQACDDPEALRRDLPE